MSKAKRYLAVDKESRFLIKHKLLQTSWTAVFGAVAILEGLVLAWWAETIYKVWSRTYSFVRVRVPWQARTEVQAEAEVTRPKRVQHRQAAIDARNE